MYNVGIIDETGHCISGALASLDNGYNIKFVCDFDPKITQQYIFLSNVTLVISKFKLANYLLSNPNSIQLIFLSATKLVPTTYLEMLNLINFQGKILCASTFDMPTYPLINIGHNIHSFDFSTIASQLESIMKNVK